MKINFKTPIMKVDNTVFSETKDGETIPYMLNETLANDVLADAPNATDNAIKFTEWAEMLHKTWELNIDSTDAKILEQLIKDSGLRTFIKWQALKLIDAARLWASISA